MKSIKTLLLLCTVVIIGLLSLRSYVNAQLEVTRNSMLEEARYKSIKQMRLTDSNAQSLIINASTKAYFYLMEKFTTLSLLEETPLTPNTSHSSFTIDFINLDDQLVDQLIVLPDSLTYQDKNYRINAPNLLNDLQTLFDSHNLQEVKLSNTNQSIVVSILNIEPNTMLLNDLYRTFHLTLADMNYKDREKDYIPDTSSPPYIIQLIYSTHTDEYLITPTEILSADKVYNSTIYQDIDTLYREQHIQYLN